MSKAKVECLQDMYKAAIKQSTATMEKFPPELRMKQFKDGKSHALWLMGHMALSLDLITGQWVLGGKPVIPADYAAKFAPDVLGGGPVQSNASAYPSWDDVFANYKKAGANLIDLLGKLDDADLGGALRGPVPEQARAFFGNLGPALTAMALHDSHHRGQILMLKGAVS